MSNNTVEFRRKNMELLQHLRQEYGPKARMAGNPKKHKWARRVRSEYEDRNRDVMTGKELWDVKGSRRRRDDGAVVRYAPHFLKTKKNSILTNKWAPQPHTPSKYAKGRKGSQ